MVNSDSAPSGRAGSLIDTDLTRSCQIPPIRSGGGRDLRDVALAPANTSRARARGGGGGRPHHAPPRRRCRRGYAGYRLQRLGDRPERSRQYVGAGGDCRLRGWLTSRRAPLQDHRRRFARRPAARGNCRFTQLGEGRAVVRAAPHRRHLRPARLGRSPRPTVPTRWSTTPAGCSAPRVSTAPPSSARRAAAGSRSTSRSAPRRSARSSRSPRRCGPLARPDLPRGAGARGGAGRGGARPRGDGRLRPADLWAPLGVDEELTTMVVENVEFSWSDDPGRWPSAGSRQARRDRRADARNHRRRTFPRSAPSASCSSAGSPARARP